MHPNTPLAPANRLASIIEGLCQAIARRLGLRGGGLAGPFIILVWSRLRRMAARFARHAITPPSASSRPQAVIASEAKQPRRRPNSASPHPLPRRSAWLLRLVPETASGASQLRHFLADPEVASLLAAAPKLQAILRPLCHMLGIRAAQALPAQALPPPDAAPAARPVPCHALPQAAPIAVPRAAFPPWSTPPPSPDAPPPAPAPPALA